MGLVMATGYRTKPRIRTLVRRFGGSGDLESGSCRTVWCCTADENGYVGVVFGRRLPEVGPPETGEAGVVGVLGRVIA